ncbi:MAG: Arm DNA-binding domain-containing protein [Dyadobacter sp.]|uniref:Arm DNA-binding domain-containing protein n=1 Tax=Dyadobacter sp. TaxID=1914288 RepID=UPI0032638721
MLCSKAFSILFYLKKRNTYISGEMSVYMRLTINNERSEIALKRDCDPQKWNAKASKMIGSKQDAKD